MPGALRYLTLRDPANPARPRHVGYYEWGNSTNPEIVVCVHGLSRNGRDFDFLAEALSPRFRVLCPDMAGRGVSDWLTGTDGYNYAVYLGDCIALLEQLQLPVVNWVGTSMGGILGMMLAAQQPTRIKRLVLNDIGAVVAAAGLKRILSYVGSRSLFNTYEEATTYLRAALAPFGIETETEWRQMFEASLVTLDGGRYALACDPAIGEAFRATVSKSEGIENIDLSAVWKLVQCPALIVRGEHSDILAANVARGMCERAAPTRLIEFAGAGHAPALLANAQIAAISDWLTT